MIRRRGTIPVPAADGAGGAVSIEWHREATQMYVEPAPTAVFLAPPP